MRCIIYIWVFLFSCGMIYAQDTLTAPKDEMLIDNDVVNPGRVVVTQTAFGIGKGKVQYTNGVLLYNRVDVGIFSFLSVHAATVTMPGLPFSCGFKLTTPRKKGYIRLAAGITYADDVGTANHNEIGTWVPHGAITFGSPGSQATLSGGVMINAYQDYTDFVSLAATQRFARRFYLLMDFMLLSSRYETVIVSSPSSSLPSSDYKAHEQFIPFIGVRYLWKKVSADLSIIPPLNQPNNFAGFPIPVGSFTYRFN